MQTDSEYFEVKDAKQCFVALVLGIGNPEQQAKFIQSRLKLANATELDLLGNDQSQHTDLARQTFESLANRPNEPESIRQLQELRRALRSSFTR